MGDFGKILEKAEGGLGVPCLFVGAVILLRPKSQQGIALHFEQRIDSCNGDMLGVVDALVALG